MSKWWIGSQPYTCRNDRFQTDINNQQSKSHGNAPAKGSVFDTALINNGSYSLWLEYVEDHKHGGNCFWLMWYDQNGAPTIPLSGVFDLADLQTMSGRLAAFIKVP